jgi:hypothetical protein
MKKLYTLLVALFVLSSVFSQTETNLKCFGWSGELSDTRDIEMHVMEGFDQALIDREDLINDEDKSQPWRFGYKYDTNISLENAGEWTPVEGGKVWRTVISCPGAQTVNLLLTDFFLPEGARLFLYDLNRSNKIGAYTAKNNRIERELGTELIHGETIIIEYFEPTSVAGVGSFTIANVIHGYRSLNQIQKDLARGLNDSGACNVDVNCPLGDDWSDQIRSVAMIVVSGNGICSGALVNNTCEDGRLLFLTANHCLGGSTASWSFRFNWESPEDTESCATFDGSTNPGPPYDQSANGATILANAGGSDFALLEIDNMTEEEAEEWDVFLAGWDRSDLETVTKATGIHHPSGDLKKICQEVDAPYHDFTGGAQVWWIDDWDEGVTEPGSSGSPLFDQNGRIIGQLYGGAAACSGTDDNDAFDYYGRMGVSWGLGASTYLAPGACGSTITLDGIDFGTDCGLTISSTATNALCFGDESGSAVVTATDGTGPYTYDIGDGPEPTGVFTGLSAGSYTVTITDALGCEESEYITISQPSNLDAIYSSTDEIEGADGAVNLTVIGGTPSYSFEWSGPGAFSSTDEDISGLISGVYEVDITDGNGCLHTEENVIVRSQLSIIENTNGLSIFPNPTNGLFFIEVENNSILDYKIRDISGRIVLVNQLQSSKIQIDLSKEAKGTYFIELTTNQGIYTERIIKR